MSKIRWTNKTNIIEIEIPVYKNITIQQNSTKCPSVKPDNIYIKPDTQASKTINKPSSNNTDENCDCDRENRLMNMVFMIGFFITLAITLFATLVCLWRCWIKDMVEEFIDDLFCCGYGNVIKDCYSWCCLCFSLVNDDSPTDEEAPPPTLATVAPVAQAVDVTRNMKIEMPRTIVEEGVTTPNGTTIKRRRLQI